ncbi:MAG: hypothetical protein PHQ81_01305 [Methanofollis sp.]|nr:hypothetical protein [Methanofollis sp.]
MKSFIGYGLVLFLLTLLFGTVATVSAADPVVIISSNESFEYNGLEVSEVSFIDLIDPEVTWTTLESTDECDQKVLTFPEIRYIFRDCPDTTIEVDGYTVTSRNVPQVDLTGMNAHPVYIKSVIPSISTVIPGETGNVVLVKTPSEVPDTTNTSYEDLFAATDTMYLYTNEGIIYVNPQTNKYVLWGSFDGIGYDPNDFGTTLMNTQVDLSNFSVDPALARDLGEAYPETTPAAGEYLCFIFGYDPTTMAMKILGVTPVSIMDKDYALTWNGGEVPATYTGNDVTLGFENGESLDGVVYFIFRKDTVFDAELMFDAENVMAMKDHPSITPTCLIDFLMQEVPGHTMAESPAEITLTADGDTMGPEDLEAVIPISTGYGISGVGEGQDVTVPVSAFSGLMEGTYIVMLCGASEDGSVIAVDQKEVTIGANSQPRRSYDSGGSDSWLSSSKRADSNEEVAEIETIVPKSDDGVKNPGGSAAIKDVRVGEGYPENTGSAEPAGNLPAVLGYAAIGLIALLGIGIVLSRGRFR